MRDIAINPEIKTKSVKSTKKTANVKKNVEKKVTPKKNIEKTSNKK